MIKQELVIFFQVRVGSGNRDFHYTHWSVLVDRITPLDFPDLSRREKTVCGDGPNPDFFYLNSEEHEMLR